MSVPKVSWQKQAMEELPIRLMTGSEAKAAFPTLKGLPSGSVTSYVLFGADGNPLALTKTLGAAIGYATEDDLKVHHLN